MEENNPNQPVNPPETPIQDQSVSSPVNNQRGFFPIILGVLVLLIVVGGGAYYLGTQNKTPEQLLPIKISSSTATTRQTVTPQSSVTPINSNFNLIFKYGVGAGNELNTFEGIYTKDMVQNPPAKIKMPLGKEEMNRIYQKMLEIKFFDYPDKFSVTPPSGEPVGMVTPCSKYFLKVEVNSKIKELSWDDCITNKDERADKLRELIRFIENIIESRTEYKGLPAPKGGYL